MASEAGTAHRQSGGGWRRTAWAAVAMLVLLPFALLLAMLWFAI
jgi:hypothetical protein